MRNRLELLINKTSAIHKSQLSSKKHARTSDHIFVVKFLISKYVKKQKKKLYACFFDLHKAFDSLNRIRLFYGLLSDFKIGGDFLSILQNIYDGYLMYVKVNGGLTEPFLTTVGVKQGDVLSPILFNMFINGLPNIFDPECDPVTINNETTNVLIWADDSMVLSTSVSGLKRAIFKTTKYFENLGLKVNCKKTKVLIFNPGGKKLDKQPEHKFYIGERQLEVTDEYTYLGLKLKPSGSFTTAIQELYAKFWFGSN